MRARTGGEHETPAGPENCFVLLRGGKLSFETKHSTHNVQQLVAWRDTVAAASQVHSFGASRKSAVCALCGLFRWGQIQDSTSGLVR